MVKEQKCVKEFMQVFGQATPEKPVQLDEKTAKLRASLILEEALETIIKGLGVNISFVDKNTGKSLTIHPEDLGGDLELRFEKENEVDLVELADGLADLSYVASHGTSVAAGIDLEPVEAEVHRSNMSKLWKNDELDQAPEGSTKTPYEENAWIVRRADGKAIKSPSYSPANIKEIIDSQLV